MSIGLSDRLREIVGASYISTDAEVLASRSVDYTGRYRGKASALVRPGSPDEVAALLRACRDAGAHVTVQGGRTSLVAGTVPQHDDVLLSTERLTGISEVDAAERHVRAGAGVSLAALQRAAAAAGLVFGVDLAARDSATIGGMASTNAGGLRTIRYGDMREQVAGIDVVLPDGSFVQRHSEVRCDNTGYDLTSLFVGAEGTLGVITELDLWLHPAPKHRFTALCGFADLDSLIDSARQFADETNIAALELIDGRGVELAGERLGIPVPMSTAWLLLIELAGSADPTDQIAAMVGGANLAAAPAVGADAAAQQRLWQIREAMAEVVGLFGPPLKFDVSLPLSAIPAFADRSAALVAEHAPNAISVLFGHIGQGNLHLNVLRCGDAAERHLYEKVLNLIAAQGGNISSEHGIGSRKRDYLSLSRQPGDIAAMRTIKAAFDSTGYLNPAVLFD